jgi:heme A synthase
VALGIMGSKPSGLLRRTAFGLLTLLLVVFITVAYHVGYEELRDREVAKPVLGNIVISIPVIATANPLGSIVAHTAMHLAAVTHAYESKDRLPPQVFVRRAHPPQ